MRVLIAALALTLAVPRARAGAEEASLRTAGDTMLAMSDEDYRDLAKANADARWSKFERPAMLSTIYSSLASARYRAAVDAGLDPELTTAGRSLSADAKSAAVDPDLLQQTGWWGDFSNYVNSDPAPRRRAAAVAAVRGGRKLSTDSDKEIAGLLAAVDAGDKAIADDNRARTHYEAARAYQKIASLTSAPSSRTAAPLSAKEIYQKDAPSVLLILGSSPGGQGELGTGSVIDSAGRVLTNAHVVIDDRTGAPFPTLRVYRKPAKVTGDTKKDLSDPVTVKVARFDRALDLALLEPSRDLGVPAIALGDDAAVEPGDPVVAIGHPEQGGLWTLTQGVVSTVVADLGGVSGKDVFQTDASINRGNSGGPLLDRSGAIVGVNTSMARKAADGLTITSVNFSIKSSVARRWLRGEAPPVAPAAPASAPEEPAKPAAPAELPPAPQTKPVVVTPAKPYRIDDLLEAEKEMEDMGRDMSEEIRRRTQPR